MHLFYWFLLWFFILHVGLGMAGAYGAYKPKAKTAGDWAFHALFYGALAVGLLVVA